MIIAVLLMLPILAIILSIGLLSISNRISATFQGAYALAQAFKFFAYCMLGANIAIIFYVIYWL